MYWFFMYRFFKKHVHVLYKIHILLCILLFKFLNSYLVSNRNQIHNLDCGAMKLHYLLTPVTYKTNNNYFCDKVKLHKITSKPKKLLVT